MKFLLFLSGFFLVASFVVAKPALALGEGCCQGVALLDPISGKCALKASLSAYWLAATPYEETCRTRPDNPFCQYISSLLSSAVIPAVPNGCKADQGESCDVLSGTCKKTGDSVRAVAAPSCPTGMITFNTVSPTFIATSLQTKFCPEMADVCCKPAQIPILSSLFSSVGLNNCDYNNSISASQLQQLISTGNYCTFLKSRLTSWDHRNVCDLPATWDNNNGANRCVVASFLSMNPYNFNCDINGDTTNYVNTAIGCIPTGKLTGPDGFLAFILRWVFGFAGGVILLMLIFTGYSLMTSTGNPEKLQAAKENLVSIFSGLILIAFSLVLLQTIGAGILKLPTF